MLFTSSLLELYSTKWTTESLLSRKIHLRFKKKKRLLTSSFCRHHRPHPCPSSLRPSCETHRDIISGVSKIMAVVKSVQRKLHFGALTQETNENHVCYRSDPVCVLLMFDSISIPR